MNFWGSKFIFNFYHKVRDCVILFLCSIIVVVILLIIKNYFENLYSSFSVVKLNKPVVYKFLAFTACTVMAFTVLITAKPCKYSDIMGRIT